MGVWKTDKLTANADAIMVQAIITDARLEAG